MGTGKVEDIGLLSFDADVNPRGVVIAAWSNADDGSVWAVYRPRGGPWSKAVSLPSPGWPLLPAVTVDADGLATVAYQGPDRHYRLVQRAGQRWRVPTVLPAHGGDEFGIDAARPGEVVLVWKARGSFRVGRLWRGEWSARRLTGPGVATFVATVVAGPRGAATFVLNAGAHHPISGLIAVSQARDGTLGPRVVVSPVPAPCGVSTVINRGGELLLAWGTDEDPEPVYAVSGRVGASRWTEPVDISQGGDAEECDRLAAGLASDGSAIITWTGRYTKPGTNTAIGGLWARQGLPAG